MPTTTVELRSGHMTLPRKLRKRKPKPDDLKRRHAVSFCAGLDRGLTPKEAIRYADEREGRFRQKW
jgi:hypothetical protein